MGKKYDWTATPRNTPRLKERRLLFLLAMGLLEVNLLVIAILHPDMQKKALICAGFVGVFSCLQYFENRKANWGWDYVVTLCVLAFLCAAGFIFGTGEYWYYIIWACEAVTVGLAAYFLLRKPRGKMK